MQDDSVRSLPPLPSRGALGMIAGAFFLLTLRSYKIDYLISGTSPFLYHFHNLLLHAANAFLVLILAYFLTGNRIAALFVGVFFAIHPLHTEAVAWASGRKDLLSTLFVLSALITYVYYKAQGGKKLFILSLFFFL